MEEEHDTTTEADETEDRLAAMDAAMDDPEIAEGVKALTDLLKDGELNFAQVGGFSEEELQGGFASATRMLESDRPAKALKVLGTLMFLNPDVAKYYRLAGIALYRLKQFELADSYYQLALLIDPEDAISLLYRGETQLILGQRFWARMLIQKGLAVAEGDPDLDAIAERSRGLAEAFGLHGL